MGRTFDAVRRQIAAMGCDVFEVGLFNRSNAPRADPICVSMLERSAGPDVV
jgi:hypothetical protein